MVGTIGWGCLLVGERGKRETLQHGRPADSRAQRYREDDDGTQGWDSERGDVEQRGRQWRKVGVMMKSRSEEVAIVMMTRVRVMMR